MRLLVTSDLHYDHGRSRHLAEELIREINDLSERDAFEVLLLVGDTATARGDAFERALSAFSHKGPRLLTFGNHELWSDPPAATLDLYLEDLPRRAREAGFHPLDVSPLTLGDTAFVGSVGWYDYRFAPGELGIPRRFYEHKISPGSAAYYTAFRYLLTPDEDIPPAALETYARWNDPKFIRWPLTDEAFHHFLLARLRAHLRQVADSPQVIAAIHHLPLAELLPPPATHAWDFAKAFLGSPLYGQLIGEFPNVRYVISGHSHFPAGAQIGPTRYLATGSGYRKKHYEIIDLK